MVGQKIPMTWRRPLYFGIFFVAALFAWAAYLGDGSLRHFHTDSLFGLLFWFPIIFYMVIGFGAALFCGLSILCFRARRWRVARPEPNKLKDWLLFFVARTSLPEWVTLNRREAAYFAVAFCFAFAWAGFNVHTIWDTTPVMVFCGDGGFLCKLTARRSLITLVFSTLHVVGIFTLLYAAWGAVSMGVSHWRSRGRSMTHP